MPNQQPANETRLSVSKAIIGAFLITWSSRKKLFRSLAIPLVFLVLLTLLPHYLGESLSTALSWLVIFFYIIFSCIFSIICHRVVLLDLPDDAGWLPQWTWRETRFLGWMMLIVAILMFTVIMLGAVFALSGVDFIKFRNRDDIEWITVALLLAPAIYICARLSLIFPATALDKIFNLRWAWRQSRNNGWRLAIVVGGLPVLTSLLINLLERDNATIFETILFAFAGTAIATVEVAALSIAYLELTKETPPH